MEAWSNKVSSVSVGEGEKASTGWRKMMAGLAQQQVESTEDDSDLGGC